jgi:hypothetical protein
LNDREIGDVLRADEELGYVDRKKQLPMRGGDCCIVERMNVERLFGRNEIVDARIPRMVNRT